MSSRSTDRFLWVQRMLPLFAVCLLLAALLRGRRVEPEERLSRPVAREQPGAREQPLPERQRRPPPARPDRKHPPLAQRNRYGQPLDPRAVTLLAGPRVYNPEYGFGAHVHSFGVSASFLSATSTPRYFDQAAWDRMRRLTRSQAGTAESEEPIKSAPTLLFDAMQPFWIRVRVTPDGAERGVEPPVWSDVGWEQATRVWLYRRGKRTPGAAPAGVGVWHRVPDEAVRITFWRKYYKRAGGIEEIHWAIGEHRTERLHGGVDHIIELFYKVEIDLERLPPPVYLLIYVSVDKRRFAVDPWPSATQRGAYGWAGRTTGAVLYRHDPENRSERLFLRQQRYQRLYSLGLLEEALQTARENMRMVTPENRWWWQYKAEVAGLLRRLGRHRELLAHMLAHPDPDDRYQKAKVRYLRDVIEGSRKPREPHPGWEILQHNLKHPEGPDSPYDHDRVVSERNAREAVARMRKIVLPHVPEKWRAAVTARLQGELLGKDLPWWNNAEKLFEPAYKSWEKRWSDIGDRLSDREGSEYRAPALAECRRIHRAAGGR